MALNNIKLVDCLQNCIIGVVLIVLASCSDDSGSAKNVINTPPSAIAEAFPKQGVAPLIVNFEGNKSTDDLAVTNYLWTFKDGSTSIEVSPSFIFTMPGTYSVELTVHDEKGLTSKDVVIIRVSGTENEEPVAVVTASKITGDVPMVVYFTASNSTDDTEITSYFWNFPNATSTESDVFQTFTEPGLYNVTLTVKDSEGLQSEQTITITVNEKCDTNGGKSTDLGLKSWCWGDTLIPDYSGSSGVPFSNGELYISSQCYEKQVTNVGHQLRFNVNPIGPEVGNWCSEEYNLRAEIRTSPWLVNHPMGTEEWFGWDYTFGDDYIPDTKNFTFIWQVHEGTRGQAALLSFLIANDEIDSGSRAGKLQVFNGTGYNNTYSDTGITPVAGQKLDIVVHVIWGDESNGLCEVWINGNKVHDLKGRTVRANNPVGGNAKWGIYKAWRYQAQVQSSLDQGITHVEAFMGPLRMITRQPDDPKNGTDAYDIVVPR